MRLWRLVFLGAVACIAACQTVGGAVSIDDGGAPADASVDATLAADASPADLDASDAAGD
jgi:hypothetical protein